MATRAMSDEAVETGTGKPMSHWCTVLDRFDAKTHGHKQAAKHLLERHRLSPWWAQMVTVLYERKRGLRALGQRSTRLFALSMQRTVAAKPTQVLTAIISALRTGGADALRRTPSRRVVCSWPDPVGSVVEVTVLGRGNVTVTQLTHDRLLSATDRERMRSVWTPMMDALRDRFAHQRM